MNFWCLEKPLKPQYGGGIVINPEISEGLKGWSKFGDAKLEQRISKDGNKFIVVSDRKALHDSPSQKFYLEKEKFYIISAWLRVSEGKSEITAAFETSTGNIKNAGTVFAQSGCWSMLKGGLVVNASGPAQLHFRSKDATSEVWVDSISLQPFNQDEWKAHQDQNIEKIRKSKVRFQAFDSQGQPLSNANISILAIRSNFPFGVAINKNILNNQAYQSWFSSRFKLTVFENEFKWFSTESSPGREDYSVADALVQFAQRSGAIIRGHNIFWEDPQFNPSWVVNLSPGAFRAAADKRVNSIVSRYRGKLIHWDVVNENLHHNLLESKLGATASALYYRRANQLDGRATPFLNDFNTIEKRNDQTSAPPKYLAKIRELRSQGYRGPLGIGLEGHFDDPDLAYIRASIDLLASARLPIWVTELDVSNRPNQAVFLDQIIREVVSHQAVQGLLIWSAWSPQGCFRMCLTDNNFRNLPTGNVVDRIIRKFEHEGLIVTTDDQGYFETSLFHGDYEAKISHPAVTSSSSVAIKFKVSPTVNQETLNVKLSPLN
ncbi:hypothetical protein ACH5RR_022271 [Cinchona calisaya]|uniref:GH10 domain-containing protein n=1 Tax=Cinchona calisaya TaxID=153742 RepID=A0ABD2Z7C5_9GENT